MNILVISNLYPPHARGGAELIAARLTHELYSRGHHMTVLSTMPYQGIASLFPAAVEHHIGTVYRFFPLNFYYTLNDHQHRAWKRALWHLVDLWSPFPAVATRRLIVETKPDVVITHNLKGVGLQVVREVRRMGVRHLHVLHDVQLSVPSGLLIYGKERRWFGRSPVRDLYERAVKQAIGSPDVVISPSKFLMDFYTARGFFPKSERHILPNPAPKMVIVPITARIPGPMRLLFAGQLEPHKGLLFLIDTLQRSGLEFALHVAGDGVLASEIQRRSEKDPRITYHGFVNLQNLLHLLQASDAVVVPSLCYENSPTILYEAFQSGTPVIASHIGGVGELVNKENGFLFQPGNAEALVDVLRPFSAAPDQFRARAASIRESVANYGLDAYVDELLTFAHDSARS